MLNAHQCSPPVSGDGSRPVGLGLDIYAAGIQDDRGEWVSLALMCPALKAWEYLEQTNPVLGGSENQRPQRPHWSTALRRVPGTRFARSASELREMACLYVTELVHDAELHRLPSSPVLLANDEGLGQALGLQSHAVGRLPRQSAILRHCLGQDTQLLPHSLVKVLDLAVADPNLRNPVTMEQSGRLELLLGRKRAQSLRSWLRRTADHRMLSPIAATQLVDGGAAAAA